jgi:hypothetical protein
MPLLKITESSVQTEDSATLVEEELKCIPNGHLGGFMGSVGGDVVKRPQFIAEHPFQYLSAAGVLVIGIAAWTVVNRVKD